MTLVLAMIVSVGIFVIYDHICYWKKLDNFERLSSEFAEMYNYLAPKFIYGKENEEFEYSGMYFEECIKVGDYKSFYKQMKLAIDKVLNSYNEIGERYLELMDEETAERIEALHQTVESIDGIIRYQCWIKGVKF